MHCPFTIVLIYLRGIVGVCTSCNDQVVRGGIAPSTFDVNIKHVIGNPFLGLFADGSPISARVGSELRECDNPFSNEVVIEVAIKGALVDSNVVMMSRQNFGDSVCNC